MVRAEESVVCPRCSAVVGRGALERHLHWELSYRPLRCRLCRDAFYTRRDAADHFRQAHPEAAVPLLLERLDPAKDELIDDLLGSLPKPSSPTPPPPSPPTASPAHSGAEDDSAQGKGSEDRRGSASSPEPSERSVERGEGEAGQSLSRTIRESEAGDWAGGAAGAPEPLYQSRVHHRMSHECRLCGGRVVRGPRADHVAVHHARIPGWGCAFCDYRRLSWTNCSVAAWAAHMRKRGHVGRPEEAFKDLRTPAALLRIRAGVLECFDHCPEGRARGRGSCEKGHDLPDARRTFTYRQKRTTKDGQTFACQVCCIPIENNQTAMLRHVVVEHIRRACWRCGECGKEFVRWWPQAQYLRGHVAARHPAKDGPSWRLLFADLRDHAYRDHIEEEILRCFGVERKRRQPSSARRLKCQLCGHFVSALRGLVLKNHILKEHVGTVAAVCSLCPAPIWSVSPAAPKNHIASQHPEETRPFYQVVRSNLTVELSARLESLYRQAFRIGSPSADAVPGLVSHTPKLNPSPGHRQRNRRKAAGASTRVTPSIPAKDAADTSAADDKPPTASGELGGRPQSSDESKDAVWESSSGGRETKEEESMMEWSVRELLSSTALETGQPLDATAALRPATAAPLIDDSQSFADDSDQLLLSEIDSEID